MSFFSNFFTPRSSFSPEQTQRIRRAIMPFSEVEDYRGKGTAVLLCATAIFAPEATTHAFFYAWQVAQFCFLMVLAYRFGRARRASS